MTAARDPGLSTGEVARRLGVAVTTLRSWDRRYGIGPQQHLPGRHRRYHDDEVARLVLMRRLLNDGVVTAEAAKLALRAEQPGLLMGNDETTTGSGPAPSQARIRGLYRAALALDTTSLDRILDASLAGGVVPAWTELICPTLRHIGTRHAATGKYIENEHMLSNTVSAALARATRVQGRPTVLLACTPDEQHTLPLQALATSLAERGTSSWLLGARVPTASIGAALQRIDAQVVVLWAHTTATADQHALDQIMSARPRTPIIAACGPGWTPSALPEGVHTPSQLVHALELIEAA